MKKLFVLSVLFAAPSMAVELSDFDFNPLVGMSWGTGGDSVNGASGSLTMGGEVIYKDKFLVGASGFNVDRHYYNMAYQDNAFKAEYRSIWGGYFVQPDLALKLGYTRQNEEFNGRSVFIDPIGGYHEITGTNEWSINYAMLGLGYHFTENLNVNLHINVPVSGGFLETKSKSDYLNSSLMFGYRF
ncbi:MAG: hypothetical protein ACRC2Y_04425 [Aeromonas veronii]